MSYSNISFEQVMYVSTDANSSTELVIQPEIYFGFLRIVEIGAVFCLDVLFLRKPSAQHVLHCSCMGQQILYGKALPISLLILYLVTFLDTTTAFSFASFIMVMILLYISVLSGSTDCFSKSFCHHRDQVYQAWPSSLGSSSLVKNLASCFCCAIEKDWYNSASSASKSLRGINIPRISAWNAYNIPWSFSQYLWVILSPDLIWFHGFL